jgi:Flp pilus assembly protein TadD
LLKAKLVGEAAQRLGEYVAGHADASATVLSWAGIAQDELGNHVNGEALHRRAAALEPKKDTLHNNLGYSLLMQGKKAEAAEEFRRALELNPASETARNNLGMALADEAGAALTQFRQTSDLGVAHNNLAAYLFEKGDLAGARRELELALEYRRDNPEIVENLRKIAAMDGQPIRLPAGERRSFWKSFARGLKTTFISGEERRSTGTAEAAR